MQDLNPYLIHDTQYIIHNLKPIPKKFWINEQIRVPEVSIIDETGNNLGKMAASQALILAKQKGLDLVEVSPKAIPPVCRIMDFGKYLYKITKQERQHKAKQKTTETKGIRLSPRISTHDMETKAKQAERFMNAGNKIKIDLLLRGREKAHIDTAEKKMHEFLEIINSNPDFTGKIVLEQRPKRQPWGLIAIISKAKK